MSPAWLQYAEWKLAIGVVCGIHLSRFLCIRWGQCNVSNRCCRSTNTPDTLALKIFQVATAELVGGVRGAAQPYAHAACCAGGGGSPDSPPAGSGMGSVAGTHRGHPGRPPPSGHYCSRQRPAHLRCLVVSSALGLTSCSTSCQISLRTHCDGVYSETCCFRIHVWPHFNKAYIFPSPDHAV